MRVERVEQILGEDRKPLVHLEPDAGVEIGDTLHQSLDVRIGVGRRVEPEQPGDLAMILGEFPGAAADIAELAVVMPEQARIDRAHDVTLTSPVSSWIEVLNSM